MLTKRIYLLSFQNKYGEHNSRNIDRGCLDKAKYKEIKVNWSIRIFNSVDKLIKTIEINKIKNIREKFIFI